MRASTLCVVVLVAGCGNPAAVPKDLGAPVGKIDARDLVDWYKVNAGPHEWEGKRIVVQFSWELVYELDGERRVCALWESNGGFNRPLIIARSDAAHDGPSKTGKTGAAVLVVTLRGARRFSDVPAFQKFGALVDGRHGMGDRFILLESPRPHKD